MGFVEEIAWDVKHESIVVRQNIPDLVYKCPKAYFARAKNLRLSISYLHNSFRFCAPASVDYQEVR